MKKIIFLLGLVIMLTSQAYSQRATLMPLAAGDTMANNGTVSKIITLTSGYEGIVIQPVLTKLSGIVTGTLILYQSLDGTNYKSTGDTLTLSNQTINHTVWNKTAPVPVYYKVYASGASSVSAILRVYYVPRLHN
jgi:hypothetical protein